jgi:hypothetical protein
MAERLRASDSKPGLPTSLERVDESKEGRPERTYVRITRRSTRLCDRSGAWESTKWIVDSLVDAQLIPGDAEKDIELSVTQEKVRTKEECGLLITITYPD